MTFETPEDQNESLLTLHTPTVLLTGADVNDCSVHEQSAHLMSMS